MTPADVSIASSGSLAINSAFLPISTANCTLPVDFDERLCPCAPNPCKREPRLEAMMRLYRREPIFGVLENKLLSKLVLRALNVPHTSWRYAALLPPDGDRTKPPIHSEAPWYDRPALLEAIRATSPTHRFVLKPLTDGGSQSVMLMDSERWETRAESLMQRKNSTVEEYLVDQLEKKALNKKNSAWRQQYEHRGCVLEDRYDGDGAAASDPSASSTAASSYELKVFVVFGVPIGIRVYPRSSTGRNLDAEEETVDQLVRTGSDAVVGGRFRCVKADTTAQSRCATAAKWINEAGHVRRLDDWASRIATLYGADWFRLDLFAGDTRRGWKVNEVTYPSHITPPDAVWAHYVSRYADRSSWANVVPAEQVLGKVSATTGIPVSFMRTRATHGMQTHLSVDNPW